MKKLFAILLLALTGQAFAADVSVTIGGQVAPGVYGEVTIGDARPRIYYPQPQIIVAQPNVVVGPPVYMYVPPSHRRDWHRWCHHYGRCGHPVYFVQEGWYHEHHGHKHKKHKHGHGHGHKHKD